MSAVPHLVEVKTVRSDDNVMSIRREVTLAASLVVGADGSGAAEAVRALRTHLMAQHFQEGRRALAVCAPSVGVGCSFVASNLALALSQIGVKTLLIDANLREPCLQTLFDTGSSGPGLAECLAFDGAPFGDFIQPDVQPDLSLMFAGRPPENPQELLAGARFQALMEFCMREFEATIVDTPAANKCADARRVSTVAGYSLVVARRDVSYVDDIKVLSEQLASDHASVVGCVLNEA